ncbi:MAG TPA: hypothetical protein VLT47_02465 [Anaeromyxobacteraceae bacterium]|nr:hypothetical protein [Anaeromyxobacteraceae bacterium]
MPVLDPRRVLYRRFSPARLVTGLAAVALGAGIQVVEGPWRGHVSADGVVAMVLGLIAGAIGVTLVLRPRADFCARCAVRLVPDGLRLAPDAIPRAAAALQAGDAEHALRLAGQPRPDGTWVTVWYCPQCRSTVVWGSGTGRAIATGGEAIVQAVMDARRPQPIKREAT